MRVAVLALDLARPVRGRGDEDREPLDADVAGPDEAEAAALLARALGHEVEVLRLSYPALERLEDLRCDVALDLCGGIGRDGFPGVEVLEALVARGVPCAGAGRDFLLLGIDKAAARARLAARGVRIAPGCVLEGGAGTHDLERLAALRPPLVVKPREGGGSVGLAVAPDATAARGLAARALRTYGGVVVEELIEGPELSVPVLGTGEEARALPPVEVAFADEVPPAERVLTFDDKLRPTDGRWWLECPARVSTATLAGAEAVARAAYAALGGSGHGRVDLRLGPDGPVVLEVNPDPTLSPVLRREEQGLYATSLRAAGLPLTRWLELLIDDALRRRRSP